MADREARLKLQEDLIAEKKRQQAVAKALASSSIELGITKVEYKSQAMDSFMSEERNQIVRQAIRDRKEPESLQLGKQLRKSHVVMSMRTEPPAQTEAKRRWTQPPKMKQAESYADIRIAELRKANIDLAVADPKSAKDWTSVLKSVHSSHADKKFACSKPQGFQELGEELRKSSVLLHAGKHDFRSEAEPVRRSEAASSFDVKPIPENINFNHLGEEARTSSFEYSYGTDKRAKGWESQQHSIFGDNQEAKWKCRQPEGFYHLIAELKKSNVTFGSDGTKYGTESLPRPLRDDRVKHAAGHVPGL